MQVIEQAVLHELQGTSFESASEDSITVRPPRLYHFSDRTNSLVIEDFPRSVRMVDYLTSMHQTGPSLPAFSIGHAVGSWLRCFHFSKSCKASPDLLAVINSNGSMQDTVFNFYYRNLTQKCERYLEGSQERMKEYAVAEFRTNADVIHGDFSTRKYVISWLPFFTFSAYLVANNHSFLMSYPAPATGTEVMIIDWETCQRGSRSQDLGRLISDLYVLQHFKVVDTDKILHGLTEGYHVLNREMAFHTAIHVGIHLFSWDTIMSTYTKEQAVSLAKFARDLIVKGWEMDQGWLEGTFLKILFQA